MVTPQQHLSLLGACPLFRSAHASLAKMTSPCIKHCMSLSALWGAPAQTFHASDTAVRPSMQIFSFLCKSTPLIFFHQSQILQLQSAGMPLLLSAGIIICRHCKSIQMCMTLGLCRKLYDSIVWLLQILRVGRFSSNMQSQFWSHVCSELAYHSAAMPEDMC